MEGQEKRVVSCCGVVCSECGYYPGDCRGCSPIQGRVFWLQFTGGDVCDIYRCCVEEKRLAHCGKCPGLPCGRYDREDPTRSHEENEAELKGQLALLRSLEEAT